MGNPDREMLDLATLFENLERALADYYLARQETGHAEIFARVRQSIAESPTHWTRGRFAPQTLKILLADVTSRLAQLRTGAMAPAYALNFIQDVESSLIESRIGEAFQTRDPELARLLDAVQQETTQHRDVLRSILTQHRT